MTASDGVVRTARVHPERDSGYRAFARRLPNRLRTAAHKALTTGADRDRVAAVDALVEYAKGRSDSADRLLTRMSPEAVRRGQEIGSATRGKPGARALLLTGNAHPLWMAAAAARGTDDSAETLLSYLQEAGRWHAAAHVLEMVREGERDVGVALAVAASAERIRRTVATSVRLMWVSELLLTAAADAVAADPASFGPMSTLTRSAVTAWFAAVRRSPGDWSGMLRISDDLDEATRDFLRLVSVPAGSVTGSFADVAHSSVFESTPVVDLASGPLPCAVREVTLGLEVAVFEAAKRLLARDAGGALFELAIAGALSKVAPPDGHLVADAAVRVSREDPGQIDVAVASEAEVLAVECKSYFAHGAAGTVANAFASLDHACEQLAKRKMAFESGVPLTSHARPELIGAEARWTGLVVTQHGYAGLTSDAGALDEIKGDRDDVAIVPVHQVVIIVRAMRNLGELRSFVSYLSDLRKLELLGAFDVTDLLGVFIGSRGYRERLLSQGKALGVALSVIPRMLPAPVAVAARRPTGPEDFRDFLKAHLVRGPGPWDASDAVVIS